MVHEGSACPAQARLMMMILSLVLMLVRLAGTANAQGADQSLRLESWTRAAYERAEPRLRQASVGVSLHEFLTTIKTKTIRTRGQVTAIIADGWVAPATSSWKEDGREVRELVFGYVEHRVLVKKAVAAFVDGRLDGVRFIAVRPSSEGHAMTIGDVVAVRELRTRDAFARAVERLQGVQPGMDHHDFEHAVGIAAVLLADGKFQALAEGMLNDRFESATLASGALRRVLWFGYDDGGRPVPRVAVELSNGRVAAIRNIEPTTSSGVAPR